MWVKHGQLESSARLDIPNDVEANQAVDTDESNSELSGSLYNGKERLGTRNMSHKKKGKTRHLSQTFGGHESQPEAL